MIKGITFLRPAGSAASYEKLASFFSALGFTPGQGWTDAASRGASFLAPLGNIEIVSGDKPVEADLFVEVTQLQAVREAALGWMRQQCSAMPPVSHR